MTDDVKKRRAQDSDEYRLARAMEALGDGVWDWDVPSGHVIFSPSYFTMAGYQPNEFPARFESWAERLHPDDRQRVNQAVDDFMTGRSALYQVPFRFRRKDSSWMWTLARGVIVKRDADGAPLRVIGAHTDIDAYVRTQEALETSERQLGITLDSISEGVVSTDTEGTITRLNQAAQDMLGEVVGKSLNECLHLESDNGSRLAQPFDDAIGDDDDFDGQLRLVTRDRVRRDVECSRSAIRDGDGVVAGVVYVIRDVTQRNRMEAHLRHGQQMQSLGQLAGGVAHDFNNMLTGILGAADLLMESTTSWREKEWIQSIIDIAVRAGELTERLTAFSHRRSSRLEPVDLHGVLEDTLAIVERVVDKRIVIDVDAAADRSTVRGNSSLLQTAILNLCVNARDAMIDGGTLRLTTQQVKVTGKQARELGINAGDHVVLTVADTGAGIPEQHAARIFEPFFTTKPVGEGTGLGLALVYNTVRDHGGAVVAESQLGAGTTFTVWLPITCEAVRPPAAAQPVAGCGTVLLVDDDASVRTSAASLLDALGYEVIQAADGELAIEQFARHHARIDLTILDMVMPRMGGSTCFKKLREIDPEARVILSSGYAPGSSIASLRRQGVADFLSKPYRIGELSAMLNKHISSTADDS